MCCAVSGSDASVCETDRKATLKWTVCTVAAGGSFAADGALLPFRVCCFVITAGT